jgi:protein SCO1/2
MIETVGTISYGGGHNGGVSVAAPRKLAACVLLLAWAGCASTAPRPERASGQPRAAAGRGDLPPLFAHPWVWRDEQGAPVRFEQWRGTPIVVTLFFTSCTSTCPLTIERLRRVTETFEREGRDATFVLVTLDPSNDTPEQLRRFKSSRQLPGRWHLLQGDEAQVRELADLLQVHVLDDAHVFHDARIVIFDRDGRLSGQVRA